jgi:hypothetical protein
MMISIDIRALHLATADATPVVAHWTRFDGNLQAPAVSALAGRHAS